jgi:predicted enzyme involved in methoxymalonyl-ACP biosynthesis
VRALVDDPAALVLTIRSADRFGDNGLVGAILARRDQDGLHIDNFVLSCRVFSRGIEQACLATVLGYARDTGAGAVLGTYRRTAKNGIVADLFPRFGFERTEGDGEDDGDGDGDGESVGAASTTAATTSAFRHDLTVELEPPPHIRLTVDFERQTA